jgi:hypothetical protein
MRNLVLLKVELTDEFKPISEDRLVAAFALAASAKNTEEVVITDGQGAEVELAVGTQFRFERVDLSALLVKSKPGETLFVVGHTAA